MGKVPRRRTAASSLTCHRFAYAGIRGPGRNSGRASESCDQPILLPGGRRLEWSATESIDDGEEGDDDRGD